MTMYCYCAVSQDKTVQPNWKLRCLYFFLHRILVACSPGAAFVFDRTVTEPVSDSWFTCWWNLGKHWRRLPGKQLLAGRCATVDAVVRNMVLMLLFWDKWVCRGPHMTSYHSGNALYDFLLPSIHCVGSQLQVFSTNETPELLRAGEKCNILGGLSL